MSIESNSSVLIIEDDDAVRSTMRLGLEQCHYNVEEAACGTSGISKFLSHSADVVISDLKLPDIDGIEVLDAIKEKDKDAIVLIVTGFASVDTAVRALEEGAFDFLAKPINFKHMDIVIRRALRERKLRLAASECSQKDHMGFVGTSAPMNRVRSQIRALAKHGLTVMIQGETGTGKELTARAIHDMSSRKNSPFLAVNCGALPESLLESELFGHVKGAFTGATSDKCGLFESAGDGTVFLDEIDSASAHTQAALLRVLDLKEVRPVGGRTTKPVAARILAACNKNLEKLVQEGTFREDLFYRVISSTIVLPPLRERVEDIPPLINYFVSECTRLNAGRATKFSPRALEMMMRYSWPGNVRELKHTVQSIVLSSQKATLRPVDLPDTLRVSETAKSSFPSLNQIECHHIKNALQLAHENRSEAARLLQIGRSTLYSLLAKYEL
ncbi:MAG: sigma-54-dependent Fis family transcriptional regulator [Candidatus Hydrogenedentes bacterium]|nr:sigma-54-dependent Fis family transcriptional regulator [Candidatus Hydrogenedentota bacterium]